MRDHIDKLNIWGLDQSALTVATSKGMFDHLNITYIKVSQRFGNDMKGQYIYDREKKTLTMLSKNCSPIVRHKVAQAKE